MLRIIRLAALIFTGILLYPPFCMGAENIVTFYPKAITRIQSPPDESKLSIICQHKIGEEFVTFIGAEKKVLLAAITKEKLKHPEKNILLRRMFVKTKTMPVPFAGNIVDWAYVFDRNNDGKIDYVAYLIGALPVKPKDFPKNFPKGSETASMDQLELFYKNSQLIFRHWADDHFSGKVNGGILESMDPERKFWVDGWTLIQSTHFDSILDTCYNFKDDINIKTADCVKSGEGYLTHRIDGESVFEAKDLDSRNKLLSLFNEAAGACRLAKDSFYQE